MTLNDNKICVTIPNEYDSTYKRIRRSLVILFFVFIIIYGYILIEKVLTTVLVNM